MKLIELVVGSLVLGGIFMVIDKAVEGYWRADYNLFLGACLQTATMVGERLFPR